MSVTGKLYENCIWGDKSGVLLNPKSYPLLFKEYGTKFGGDGVNTFGIPNFSDCAIWANKTPGQRLGAALPNIKGSSPNNSIGCEWLNRDISGFNNSFSGAIYRISSSNGGGADSTARLKWTLGFNASRSSSVYKDGTTTVYPNRMTVRVMIRYQ